MSITSRDENSVSQSDPIKEAIPYVAPMALFLALTYLEGYIKPYPLAYGMKVAVVTAALLYFARAWRQEIRPEWRVVLPAVLVGLATFGEWVWLDKAVAYPPLGSRAAYNPNTEITDPTLRTLFIAVRLYGLAVLVPLMEEVFWRSWLLRFATDQEKWRTLPVGTASAVAFLVMVVLFALAHPEWLVAAVCAALYGGLLLYTRSLFACILAHAVTNLALGIYVLLSGEWKYW